MDPRDRKLEHAGFWKQQLLGWANIPPAELSPRRDSKTVIAKNLCLLSNILAHSYMWVSRWQAEREDKGRSAPLSAVNCSGKFHGLWQVAFLYSHILLIVNSIKAVLSKHMFTNLDLSAGQPQAHRIEWQRWYHPVNEPQDFALYLEHLLPGSRRSSQTSPQPLSQSSLWVSRRSISLKEKSVSLSFLCLFPQTDGTAMTGFTLFKKKRKRNTCEDLIGFINQCMIPAASQLATRRKIVQHGRFL